MFHGGLLSDEGPSLQADCGKTYAELRQSH
jgi:hypothetical protein